MWVVALLAGFSFAGFDFFALPGSRALEGSRFSARQRQRVRVWARQRCCGPQGSKLECLARKTFEPCDPNPSCAGHHGESLKFPGICYCNSYCDFISKMTMFRNLRVVHHPARFSLAGFEFFVRQGSRAREQSAFSAPGARGFQILDNGDAWWTPGFEFLGAPALLWTPGFEI